MTGYLKRWLAQWLMPEITREQQKAALRATSQRRFRKHDEEFRLTIKAIDKRL